jgi:ferredoxin
MIAELTTEIRRFVHDWPDCHLSGVTNYFDEPLVGVADGDDPLFLELQQIIGPFHWTPRQLFIDSGTDTKDSPLSVICWVLPICATVRESNRPETLYPSREWALTRTYGENLNIALRTHVVRWLNERGISSIAPQLVEGWAQRDDPSVGIASSWSERHAAYAAGLGTFSLNDGLITERGISHRLGSVVAATAMPRTVRSKGVRDNCLFHARGICGACVKRCPVGALSLKGHDKNLCREHVYGTAPREVGQLFNVAQTGCGLCQTAVPCESVNPCLTTRRTSDMECRNGCAACCIAPSISSPIPGMPHGKPSGVRCIQLSDDNRCNIFNSELRPRVCGSLQPEREMCGESSAEALSTLTLWETASRK